jgi:hypothetical protein
MLQVEIRKDITEYQEKIIAGLSLRQLAYGSAAVVVGIGSFFLLKQLGMRMEDAGFIVILASAPLFAFGFVRPEGEPLEKYLGRMFRYSFFPKRRVYKTDMSALEVTKEEHKDKTQKKKKKSVECKECVVLEVNPQKRRRELRKQYRKMKV